MALALHHHSETAEHALRHLFDGAVRHAGDAAKHAGEEARGFGSFWAELGGAVLSAVRPESEDHRHEREVVAQAALDYQLLVEKFGAAMSSLLPQPETQADSTETVAPADDIRPDDPMSPAA